MGNHKAEHALGIAIANLYIAAQGISLTASDCACDALEGASIWTKLGFNQTLSKDGRYQTRA